MADVRSSSPRIEAVIDQSLKPWLTPARLKVGHVSIF